MNNTNSKNLLSRNEASQLLGVCLRTFDALLKSGKLIPIRIGRRVLFQRQDIEAFIQKNRLSTPQDDTELIEQTGWNFYTGWCRNYW